MSGLSNDLVVSLVLLDGWTLNTVSHWDLDYLLAWCLEDQGRLETGMASYWYTHFDWNIS
jgi:hypothetical protein